MDKKWVKVEMGVRDCIWTLNMAYTYAKTLSEGKLEGRRKLDIACLRGHLDEAKNVMDWLCKTTKELDNNGQQDKVGLN